MWSVSHKSGEEMEL